VPPPFKLDGIKEPPLMQFTNSVGKPLVDLRVGRNYDDANYLVLEQAAARIAIPVDEICPLADMLVDISELLSKTVNDPARPNAIQGK
jgi:hypothetical protein